MATTELHLRVVTPDRVVFDRKVKAVSFMGIDGSYGILPGHAPLMTATKPGIVKITLENGQVEEMLVTDGFAEIRGNVLSLITDAGERAEEIDIDRAKVAEKRARERLAHERGKSPLTDPALQRAVLRQVLFGRRRAGTGDVR
ncbi:MAG: ATP synthase F1 subunit epsilon [Planctomycetota bacterium]